MSVQDPIELLADVGNKIILCVIDRTERTNAHRVREADALLAAFHAMTGVNPSPDADGPDTALGDLLAHLMHWADAKEIDFDECLRLARGHHADEVADETPGEEDIPQYVREHEEEQARITEEYEAQVEHGEVWRNYYVCANRHAPECWEDVWSCKCDDECPICGASVSPHWSERVE